MTSDPTGELSQTLPGHGPAQVDVVRSEEQVRVSTRSYVTGTVRVRKVLVTEERTVTVRVQREELRLEEQPAQDGGAEDQVAPDVGHQLGSGAPLELVLHEQRPVITYETVPVERVRIGTRVVGGEQTVRSDVRREVVELDDPGPSG